MPKKVLPTIKSFGDFRGLMQDCGFKKLDGDEMMIYSTLRPMAEKEFGFEYSANGLSVIVWTTWVESVSAAQESDMGWVLIIQEGEKAYSHCFNRTKNFLLRLLRYARIAKRRIVARPVCEEHSIFMRVKFGRGIKSRYWACSEKNHRDKKSARRDFDFGLTDEMKKFLEAERKMRARWIEKLRKEGRPTHTTMFKRSRRQVI